MVSRFYRSIMVDSFDVVAIKRVEMRAKVASHSLYFRCILHEADYPNRLNRLLQTSQSFKSYSRHSAISVQYSKCVIQHDTSDECATHHIARRLPFRWRLVILHPRRSSAVAGSRRTISTYKSTPQDPSNRTHPIRPATGDRYDSCLPASTALSLLWLQ